MLRASTEIKGETVDVRAVRDGDAAADTNVPHGEILLAWTDAAMARDEAATARARTHALDTLGGTASVDAAAIIGNFERMTRIADATGIPLDPPVNALAADVQDDLGLRDFRSAANTATASAWATLAARLLRPIALRMMPLTSRLFRLRG